MGMHHYEGNALPRVALQPIVNSLLQGRDEIAVARARVQQERFHRPEEQIEERLLVVGASRLAQDKQVWIVLMHLPLRHLHAPGAARFPPERKNSAFDGAPIRLR